MAVKILLKCLIFIYIYDISCIHCKSESNDCSIDIKILSQKTPIFTKNDELQVPNGGILSWKSGEQSDIICNGRNNLLAGETKSFGQISCDKNKRLVINGKQINPAQIECSSMNSGSIQKTKKTCLNDGIIFEVGFPSSNDELVKYFEICYNEARASVLYTSHTIPGKAINFSISGKDRPSFSVKEMPKNVKPNTSYKKEEQKTRFENLLGRKTADLYINSNSFLARGHLTPDKDGIFRSWQLATYFYLNVAPQWQNINSANWLKVENLTRKKAALLNQDLEVTTGTIGILQLKNDKGKLVSITLEENGIEVPQYFWKIISHNKASIAFISSNNPFENTLPLCKDICKEYSWPTTDFDVKEKGLTKCCSTEALYKEFKGQIPKHLVSTKVLAF